MSTVPGDPASTSVLGGALRRQALTLLAARERLEAAHGRAARRGSSSRAGTPPGTAPTGAPAGSLTGAAIGTPLGAMAESALLLGTAEQLDRVGALLQSWATDAAESAARVREIATDAARHDLYVDGRLVLEAPGPSRVEPSARVAARERLQQLLNRVTAQDGRSRGRLQRELEASAAVLARTSERARLGHD